MERNSVDRDECRESSSVRSHAHILQASDMHAQNVSVRDSGMKGKELESPYKTYLAHITTNMCT